MPDDNNTLTAAPPKAAPKPRVMKKPRQVKAYKELFEDEQKEHAELKAKTNMAIILLSKAVTMDPAAAKTIMEAAVETLTGE